MFKKLDQYIITTFFGPFLFIFSTLFFIFVVNIIWIQLAQFMGKGLSYWEIIKLLFYMGVNVISLVLPLTILLASIMTFGEFGERYELAAMKAAGISLTRIMMPLFITVIFLSTLLFFFSNNIIPDFQRKAKNMLQNIAATKPALNFTPGQFIDQIPGYQVKFDKISGENGENIEGVFVHKNANSYQSQQSIVAKKGKFSPAKDRNFLKLVLYNGYIFDDSYAASDYSNALKQPDQAIKFDTLTSHFDISEIINKAIENEKITDDYRFQTYGKLKATVDKTRKENNINYTTVAAELVNQTNSFAQYSTTEKPAKANYDEIFERLPQNKKLEALYGAHSKIENLRSAAISKWDQLRPQIKYFSKVVMYRERIISNSVTCVVFFLIGASLGSIIRKGGLGLPVVIAIVIFIIYYVLNLSVENIAWVGKMDPILAAWLPNMLLFPFGFWLTYKALTDSQVFDIEKYKVWFKPIVSRFSRKKEHERYQ